MKYYSGRFRPKNIDKYTGDHTKIQYRSMWERQVFRWCDTSSAVKKWSSEENIIPYICKTDGKKHRYFPDLKVTFSNNKTYLIEIKPKAQTLEPKIPKRRTKKFLNEVLTYAKNISKWEAAEEWCEDHGYEFAIWTEETIKSLGIKLLT